MVSVPSRSMLQDPNLRFESPLDRVLLTQRKVGGLTLKRIVGACIPVAEFSRALEGILMVI